MLNKEQITLLHNVNFLEKTINFLGKAKKEKLNLEQVEEKATNLYGLSKILRNVKNLKENLDMIFEKVLLENIELVAKMLQEKRDNKEIISFLFEETYKLYEKEEKARLEEIEKQEELEKQKQV